MDAYRPPAYDGPSSPSATPVVSGSNLFVPRDHRLPRVCLKCASTDKERIRFEQREFRQPSAGERLGGAGGAVGAVVASQFRHDIATAAAVGALVGGVGGGLIWLGTRSSPRATVEIPLCEACLERIANANSTRRVVIVGLLGGLVVALFGLFAGASILAWIGGLVFVGTMILAFSAKLPAWQFACQTVTADGVTIGGVTPAALTAISEKLVKREKKRRKAAKAETEQPADAE